MGGIYAGWFTPTEAAGVGCAGVLVLTAALRKLTRKGVRDALENTALVSAMIFAIIIGGYLMARFVAVTGLTELLVDRIVTLELGRLPFLLLLVLLYVILGAFLDVFGMLVLTIPLTTKERILKYPYTTTVSPSKTTGLDEKSYAIGFQILPLPVRSFRKHLGRLTKRENDDLFDHLESLLEL